jgi:hypothetical protein
MSKRRFGEGGSSASWLNCSQTLGPNGTRAECVGEAARLKLTVRFNCSHCGMRYFDALGGIRKGKFEREWTHADVAKEFRCDPTDVACKVRNVSFINWLKEGECYER